MKDLRGTLPYMSPELVADPDGVTEKADVWSLGIVLWEMAVRKPPHATLAPQDIVRGLMAGSPLTPEVPSWVEPEWRHLMEAAWDPVPSRRPSFRELGEQLRRIVEQCDAEEEEAAEKARAAASEAAAAAAAAAAARG